MTQTWPFLDPPNTAAITVRDVLEGAPILLVSHDDEDGSWQFHTAGGASIGAARVVGLGSIVSMDPSIGELSDLPLGWRASRESVGAPWIRTAELDPGAGPRCATCGQVHEGPPLDVAFSRPDAYLRIPETEREARCRSTDDVCVIDEAQFFIRGVVSLPLTDVDDYAALGVWAEVSRADLERYTLLYSDPSQADEPPFSARLATSLRGYDGAEGLPLEVRLTSARERPTFKVDHSSHPLDQDQSQGISLQRWFALLHELVL